VVGAYPPSGTYDECTGKPTSTQRAQDHPEGRKPKADPVYGKMGR